jgi:hypothetical protein
VAGGLCRQLTTVTRPHSVPLLWTTREQAFCAARGARTAGEDAVRRDILERPVRGMRGRGFTSRDVAVECVGSGRNSRKGERYVHWGLVIEVAAVAAVIVAMDVVGRWCRFRQNIRLGIVLRGPRRRVRFRLRHRRPDGARLAPVVSLQRYARHRTFVTFRTRTLRDHDAE